MTEFAIPPENLMKDSGSCTEACKYLKPLLIAAVILVAVFLVYRFLSKDKKSAAIYQVPAQNSKPNYHQGDKIKQQEPYPKSIPSFPVQPFEGTQKFAAYQAESSNASKYNNGMNFQSYQDMKNPAYAGSGSYSNSQQNMNTAQELNDANFDSMVGTQRAVVALIMNGCGHCTALMPAFMEASKQSRIPFFFAERSQAPAHASKYQISGFPTIFLFDAGSPVKTFSGPRTVEALLAFTQ